LYSCIVSYETEYPVVFFIKKTRILAYFRRLKKSFRGVKFFTEFLTLLKNGVIDQIFGNLTANELLMASMTCKLWRKHALRAPLWAQLCKNKNWFKLEKILLQDLTPKQFENETKYRRLYYRANKLKHNWRNGESKSKFFKKITPENGPKKGSTNVENCFLTISFLKFMALFWVDFLYFLTNDFCRAFCRQIP